MSIAPTATSPSASRWVRIRGACPACGHGGGWCTRSCNGEIVKCMRAANDHPIRQRDGTTAWLYRADRLTGGPLPKARPLPSPPRRSTAEWRNLIKCHQSAVNPVRLAKLATGLGLSVRALRLFGIGLDVGDGHAESVGTGWWSFPMYDGDRRPIGVRLRADDGAKKCVWGSANGLFIPTDYDPAPIVEGVTDDEAPLLLLFPEGPTSAAAGADLGFRCVGRPNNRAGAAMIRQLLEQGAAQDIVILADEEPLKWVGILEHGQVPTWPGWEGALHVAGELLSCGGVRRLRIVKPPKDAEGKRPKDLRAFLQAGGVANVVNAIIAAAQDVDAAWVRSKWREVELWRGRLKRNPPTAANAAKGSV